MLAALGLFVFEQLTFPFAVLDRRSDWRHARTPRVGARDAVQFVGPGEDGIRLGGALIPDLGASYASIDTLRRMADEGETYDFVDGTGRVWGSFVITGLDESRRSLLLDGTPRWIDFTVELARVS